MMEVWESIIMRLVLSKRKQKELMDKILSNISVKTAAEGCSLSERTIRDWRRGKFTMDVDCLRRLCDKSKIKFPERYYLKSDFWYTHKKSNAGAVACIEKYGYIGGDPDNRKKKWHEWWEREGQYKKSWINQQSIQVKNPRYSNKLAEWVGIVLGDGGITTTQINFTFHLEDDKEFGSFLVKLTKELFDINMKHIESPKYSVRRYYISRKLLVKFCVDSLGLSIGSKVRQQVGVPEWIINNSNYSKSCLRGLIDTDGAVFTHRYKVNGKEYKSKKLNFTNLSRPIIKFVYKTLKEQGFNPRLARDKEVCLDSKKDMVNYFKKIGTNNQKHLNNYLK